MTSRIHKEIAKTISDVLKLSPNSKILTSCLETRKSQKDSLPEIHLDISKISGNELSRDSTVHALSSQSFDKNLIEDIYIKSASKYVFRLNPDAFLEESLSSLDRPNRSRSRIVVEFSSPNIAKPFHVGHLRSTIIGNFVGNLHQYFGYDVVKLNYLGDWGTQFGLLQVGLELSGLTDEEIKKNPIENLYNAYVLANSAAKDSPQIAHRARELFTELETNETSSHRRRWEKFREYTVDELRAIYSRLGVQFHQYDWESQYSQKHISQTLDILQERKVLLNEVDGRRIVQVGDRRVPVMKSDGSTLYLARDIAALLDRFQRYQFERIFYVVDNGQNDHFNALFHVAAGVDEKLSERAKHVKFGRIKGMSTRAGNVIFLKDILDEARDIMHHKQVESPTTKIEVGSIASSVADVLGISAVVVNDLKQRRQRDYEFDWANALQTNGDTGIKLQYTHCRLCSLIENVPVSPAIVVNAKLLKEPEAMNLAIEISKFPEIMARSHESLEACILVNYLFGLSNVVSRALKRLNVKNESSKDVQQQRLLLFVKARTILRTGMEILGLRVLEKM